MASAFVFANGGGETDELVIGLSLPTQSEARWVSDRITMEEYAEELGVTLLVQVSNTDQAQQAAQVENLITRGVDVLILAPNDASASAVLADAAAEEGIPVISYDRLITNTENVALYISFDNVGVGRLQGEYFVENTPAGNIIVLSGASTDNNAKLFKEGAMEFIQPKIDDGTYTVVAEQSVTDWLPTNALSIVENALTAANNDVVGILAPNDGTAGGAIVALEAQGLAGQVVVTGQDSDAAAAKRILAGTQSMTVFKDTRDLGRAAIDAAILFAQGETVDTNCAVDNGAFDVPSLLLVPYVVTADNVEELLVGSGYLSASDLE
jgi:D-xylose transport system substrate-binding protein